MNITDSKQTPLHVAFEEISAKAAARGACYRARDRISSKKTLIDAGRYYQQNNNADGV